MNEIELKHIVSNGDNTREPAPNLQGFGYGVVEPVEGTGKPSLFALALGTPDDKRLFCKLVEQEEEGLADLAHSIDRQGQLQNCRVRPVGDGQYALTFGARRCLAALYRHAKGGKPAKVSATVSQADEKAAVIESAAENIHLPPSYIDQGRLFLRLQNQGLTVKEIGKVCPMGKSTEQNIRHRIRLLELTPQEQLLIHHGKLSQQAGLNLLKQRGGGETSTPTKSLHRKKRGQRKEPITNGMDELRAALQEFIDRLVAIDLESLPPSDPDEVLRLAEEARSLLSAVEEKASNGTPASVG